MTHQPLALKSLRLRRLALLSPSPPYWYFLEVLEHILPPTGVVQAGPSLGQLAHLAGKNSHHFCSIYSAASDSCDLHSTLQSKGLWPTFGSSGE